MFANIGIAINGLLRSRKVWVWLLACVTTGVLAIFDNTPQATQLFVDTLREGGALLGILIAGEDIAGKLSARPTVVAVASEGEIVTTEIVTTSEPAG